jgi:DNA-binding protein H-NS
LPRELGMSTPDALDQPEHAMSDFNLAAMSLAELRALQKSVAKAISTFEEPKRKRAPSTKIYRHPENSAVTWSGRGRKPGWFAAHVDAGKDPVELLG